MSGMDEPQNAPPVTPREHAAFLLLALALLLCMAEPTSAAGWLIYPAAGLCARLAQVMLRE